ncbi:MAG: site-specific integrase, partial [Micavibrio aeruginosavorus]
MSKKKLKGRPSRYSAYENILKDHAPMSMKKRPVYANGIGIFRGKTGDKVFLKIFLRHQNKSVEFPVGNLHSWEWASLEAERDKLQRRADRNEPLNDEACPTFCEYADTWLEIAKTRQKNFLTSQYTLKNSLFPAFGKTLIKDISVRQINLWQAKRQREVK